MSRKRGRQKPVAQASSAEPVPQDSILGTPISKAVWRVAATVIVSLISLLFWQGKQLYVGLQADFAELRGRIAEDKSALQSRLDQDRIDIEILQAIAAQANPDLAAAIILQSKDFISRLTPEQVATLQEKMIRNPTRGPLRSALEEVPFLTDPEKADLVDSVPPEPPKNLQFSF